MHNIYNIIICFFDLDENRTFFAEHIDNETMMAEDIMNRGNYVLVSCQYAIGLSLFFAVFSRSILQFYSNNTDFFKLYERFISRVFNHSHILFFVSQLSK